MRHRTNTILAAGWCKLVKSTNPKTGRVHYVVHAIPWSLPNKLSEVQDHFDPHRCRGAKYGSSWKFRSRKEAEQLITIALLKWGCGNVV